LKRGHSARANARRARGFSLIELLVVVALVGLLAGIALIATGVAGVERTLEREARRMAQALNLACERAVLSGRDQGLHLAAARYGFSVQGAELWQINRDGPLAPHQLASGLGLRVPGLAPDEQPEVDWGDRPDVLCFSSGELTPFELALSTADGRSVYLLRGSFDGRIDVRRGP